MESHYYQCSEGTKSIEDDLCFLYIPTSLKIWHNVLIIVELFFSTYRVIIPHEFSRYYSVWLEYKTHLTYGWRPLLKLEAWYWNLVCTYCVTKWEKHILVIHQFINGRAEATWPEVCNWKKKNWCWYSSGKKKKKKSFSVSFW